MPDKRGFLPREYWDKERAKDYSKSSSIEKIQKKITERCLQLLENKGGKILDIGCGGGFSLEVLENKEYEVIGLDISNPMLKIAKRKGHKKLIEGDFKKMPFKDSSFDTVISISTLQWIQATDLEEVREEYRKAAEEIFRVLKSKGDAIIQFYPETEKELNEAAEQFKKVGLEGEIVIDEEESPKKADRKYLVLKKG